MNKIPSTIGVGSDMELFLYDNETQQVVPCVGILPGTKDSPFQPDGMPDGFAIQEDNVMVEYNVPPASSFQQFAKNMRKGRVMVLSELVKLYGSRYGLYTKSPSHTFDPVFLTTPQSTTIGCEPDFDAYEGGQMRYNPPPPGNVRSCGGHVHLGGDFKCPDFVAALFAELFIGVRGRIHASPTSQRSAWYGKPGIYRPKPYGVEYRTPDNQWSTDPNQCEKMGAYALACARWLTETESVKIQQAFRTIPWLKVRDFMRGPKSTESSKLLYHQVVQAAMKAGVPL